MTRQGVWRGLISQHGLSMLEMTLVLLTASLLSWAAMAAYATVERDRERAQGLAQAQQMQVALRAYAMRHGRLPCPDTGGTGYEAAGCPAGALVGGYPYASVGLDVPPPGLRARYAVLRQASATPGQDADLAVTLERTGDVPGDFHHQDVTDLIVGLNNAAALPVSPSHPHLTGDGSGPAGNVDCAANRVTLVAYWIVLPQRDSNGDGEVLDPPHVATGLCVASPSAPMRSDFDDIVRAESPAQLAGWLRRSMP